MKSVIHETYTYRRLKRKIRKVILFTLILNLAVFGFVVYLHTKYEHMQVQTLESLTYTNMELEKIRELEQRQLMFHKGKEAETVRENEKAIQTKVETVKAELKEDERIYITRICMAEAGANYEGCLAVAQCIYDRAALWGKTPIEIATAYKQFAKPRQGELYDESVRAVADVFDNHKRAFPKSNVTHFYSGENVPYWAFGKTFIGEIGGNKFYI